MRNFSQLAAPVGASTVIVMDLQSPGELLFCSSYSCLRLQGQQLSNMLCSYCTFCETLQLIIEQHAHQSNFDSYYRSVYPGKMKKFGESHLSRRTHALFNRQSLFPASSARLVDPAKLILCLIPFLRVRLSSFPHCIRHNSYYKIFFSVVLILEDIFIK